MDKQIGVLNVPVFIMSNLVNHADDFTSDYTGVIGLGLPTYKESKIEHASIIYMMGKYNTVKELVFSYNITFKPNPGQSYEDSYIQIGPISD